VKKQVEAPGGDTGDDKQKSRDRARQKLLHDVFLTDKESRPVIEMVEY